MTAFYFQGESRLEVVNCAISDFPNAGIRVSPNAATTVLISHPSTSYSTLRRTLRAALRHPLKLTVEPATMPYPKSCTGSDEVLNAEGRTKVCPAFMSQTSASSPIVRSRVTQRTSLSADHTARYGRSLPCVGDDPGNWGK